MLSGGGWCVSPTTINFWWCSTLQCWIVVPWNKPFFSSQLTIPICFGISRDVHRVSIMTMLEDPGFEYQGGKRFFSSPKHADWLWGSPSLLCSGFQVSFLVVEKLACDIYHPLPSGADVKNEWSYISYLPVCLHALERDNCTLWGVYNFYRYYAICYPKL